MKKELKISLGLHAMLVMTLVILGFVRPPAPEKPERIKVRLRSAAPATEPRRTAPREVATPKPELQPPPRPPATPRQLAHKTRKAAAKKILKKSKILEHPPTPTPEPGAVEIAKAEEAPRSTPRKTPRSTPEPTPKETPYQPPPRKEAEPAPKTKETPYRAPDKPASANVATVAAAPGISTRDLEINNTWDLDAAYAERALFFIQQNFRAPYSRPGTTCTVAFSIGRDGMISDPRLRRSSGDVELDRAAFAALTATDTLPPLYASYKKPFMLVEVTFDFGQSN